MGRTCCVQKLFLLFRTIYVHNMFSPCSAKIRASDKDLPVLLYYTLPIIHTGWKISLYLQWYFVTIYILVDLKIMGWNIYKASTDNSTKYSGVGHVSSVSNGHRVLDKFFRSLCFVFTLGLLALKSKAERKHCRF